MHQIPADSLRGENVAAGKQAVALIRDCLDLIPVCLQLPDGFPDGGAADVQLLRHRSTGDKSIRMCLQDLQNLFFRHAGISSFDTAGHRRLTSAAARTILIPSGIR